MKKRFWGLLPFCCIIIIWYCLNVTNHVPSSILPPINKVVSSFIKLILSGQLLNDVLISLSRILKSYFLSIVVGCLVGILMGASENTRAVLSLFITAVRQIPIIAWVPILILWCGIGELSKIAIIFISAVFPIILNTNDGICETPPEYIEVAQLYKLNRRELFTKIYLPYAMPQIFTGFRIGLGASWMAVVSSEIIASTSGIGYRMAEARSLMRSDIVIVCMIVIGLTGIVMDITLNKISLLLLPWKKRNNKEEKSWSNR